jgi:ATP-dependent DNA helicase RecG
MDRRSGRSWAPTRSASSSTRASATDGRELVRKVLLLEKSHGFRDRAVVGGLESFVKQWLPAGPVAATLDGYDALDPVARAARVEAALATFAPPTAPPLEPAPSHGVLSAGSSTAPRPSGPDPLSVARESAPPSAAGARTTPRAKPAANLGLATPLSRLKGCGPANSRRLEKLGLQTVRDLLFHFPARHIDYSALKKVNELAVGDVATVVVTVWDVGTFSTLRGMVRIEAVTGDETGNLLAVWFRRRDYFGSKLRGQQLVLSGRVESRNGRLYVNDPEMEFLEQADLVSTARLVPFYPLTEGLNQRWLRNLAKGAVERYAALLDDHLPTRLRQEHRLAELPEAVAQMHFPDDEEALGRARRRLAFDELFLIQIGVAQRKRAWREDATAPRLPVDPGMDAVLRLSLPFHLTRAQERVIGQIVADLAEARPMARLLQGDVGAGKTVVAALAMLAANASGHQALLMAPTEILAEQHHRTIARLLGAPTVRAEFARRRGRPGPEVALLIGSTPRGERKRIVEGAASGTIDVVVGTQTLIQESVTVARLGLGVVDEQHRFGVLQRSALRQKGQNPHLLVMTATPIPRTLAMTVYGELDVSVIDELPPGRQAVKTRWLDQHQRKGAYEFLRREVKSGRQAFVVCPLVEESEKVAARAATAEFDRLRAEVYPDLRLGLLHGRMSNAEKDAQMRAFRDGEIEVLVATTVIEVGIDVPNATVMLIEGADRFGLAQLHQLRGRVGRGAEQSYCMLLSEAPSLDGRERLRVIEETNDGFALAEEDLRIRGPGEFLGTRQSGLPDLKVATLGDLQMIEETRRAAFGLIDLDPGLTHPENAALRERVARLAESATDLS